MCKPKGWEWMQGLAYWNLEEHFQQRMHIVVPNNTSGGHKKGGWVLLQTSRKKSSERQGVYPSFGCFEQENHSLICRLKGI